MTQHINPGTDTTINPVVIDDSYRERKRPNTHLHPGKGQYWECSEGYDTRDCSLICACQSPPPCATHTPAHPPEAQQRIDAAINELEITIKDCENIKGATIDTEGKAFWRGCIAQAKDTIALLQAGRK